jgi:hypothetical protein
VNGFGHVSRRAFIGITASSLVVLGEVLRRTWGAGPCRCGADIIAASRPQGSADAAGFCPNCGRSLTLQMFQLRERGWRDGANERLRWDGAQVPFPNPALVRATDKPTATMARVSV